MGVLDLWAHLHQDIATILATARQPDKCETTMLFGVTVLMVLVAGSIRSFYNVSRGAVRHAELATDMSTGALSLSLTVPLAILCNSSHFIPVDHQTPVWIYMVPLLPKAALQFSSRVLSDVTGSDVEIHALINRVQAFAAMTFAVAVMMVASRSSLSTRPVKLRNTAMITLLKLTAIVGLFAALFATTPFVVFQAHNAPWIPYVIGAVILACMIALIPGRRKKNGA